MNLNYLSRRILVSLSGMLLVSCLVSCARNELSNSAGVSHSPPARVEIRQSNGKFQMLVNNRPFYVKGAGLEFGSQEKLAAHGGNTFRTWCTENGRESGQAVLDRAHTNGLYVA